MVAINGKQSLFYCYFREVSHPNLLSVIPIRSYDYPDCSNIATISPISLKASKSLIWITAKDKYSGQTLRCEAKLGQIQKLEIQTHFKQFYVDNYEYLHLNAYDDEGNLFNSLEGFRFEWNIEKGGDIAKIVTIQESGKKLSEVKRQMEISKLDSDVLFLKGLKSGTMTISVKVNEQGYETVPLTQVVLTITEPFVIQPPHTVYLLPTCQYNFKLAKVSLKNMEMQFFPIKLPNHNYQWNLDQDDKGVIGEDGSFISKDKEGLVTIHVVDQSIKNNTAEGSVKVVYPFILDLDIVDVTEQLTNKSTLLHDDFEKSFVNQLDIQGWDNNWVLVEGHYYFIKVFVYDRDKNPIQLTENLEFSNNVNREYFDVVKENKIKSEMIVFAKQPTEQHQKIPYVSVFEKIRSQIQATYPIDKTRLRQEREIRITRPVKISHPTDLILLPLIRGHDEASSGEIWQLQAEGGSGQYQWSILNENIAKVSGQGVLKSREIGDTIVVVRDNLNNRNTHSLKVEVTNVFQLTWLEDHVEIERNKEISTLNIIALDRLGRKFTNCTSIAVQFEIKGDNIINSVPTANDYQKNQEFVEANKNLLFLKQRFDENPQALVVADLKKIDPLTLLQERILLHNNFGICRQQRIEAVGDGLGRVKAYYSSSLDTISSSKLIESGYVEVGAYSKLETSLPNYLLFFADLYSVNKGDNSVETSFHKDYTDGVFDLSFGASLVWTIIGGTNFWKEILEKYQVAQTSILLNQEEGSLDPSLLSFEKVQETTNVFRYQLSCQRPSDRYKLVKSHRFRVNLVQQNIQSRYLLKPAVHQLSIHIHCEPPQSEKIHWAQESRELNPAQQKRLPRFKLINNEKVNYVLVNSKHYVRSLFYDIQNQVFFNYSSISNSLISTNEQMLRLWSLTDDYQSSVLQNVYDKRRVDVYNITGTVYIQGVANGYLKSYKYDSYDKLHLAHEVKDQMRIEVVKNVDIQPKYKSVYIKNDFKFRIIHGSGHFQVHLNNTNLAVAVERDGNLTITPLKEGPLQITVEDVEIPDSEMAIAEILISDIAKIELDSPGSLIEQASTMELFVSAFDNYGVEFDQDQYSSMRFDIEIERTEIQTHAGFRGLVAVSQPDNRKFEAQGNEPGNYQLTAYSFKYQPATVSYKSGESHTRIRVTSEMLRIEVFPFLEFHPGSLLLTPLMRYTLQIVGGPSRVGQSQYLSGGSVQIKFDIEDQKIATVDMFREITGHEVGETKLYYELVQLKPSKVTGVEKRSIISKKTVPIKVQLVTSIEIPQNNQREVYQGSMIKLNAILKFNEETFTHGVAPISYNWNCSNHGILLIQMPYKEGQVQLLGSEIVMASRKIRDNEQNKNDVVFFTHFNSSSIYLSANKHGEALISLLLAIEYPEKYRNNKNYFNTRIVLKVAEKLYIGVPEFMNNPDLQTHLYLMPPNTMSKIETNKKTRLRLGKSQQSIYDYAAKQQIDIESQVPIIQLIQDEAIRTTDRYGKVTVIVEENQAFSGQVVMLNVLVTDIYNIAVKDAYQALNMPLGSSMKLSVKFQNDKAHLFANNIEGIGVGIELSHPRVASVSLESYNQSITVSALGSGDCNVILYLTSNPTHIFDVFRVRVTSIVKPPSPVSLHVGGQVQFKLMGDSSTISQQEGQTLWSSSSPSILDINQLTGEARGLSEGKAEVMLSNHINAASIIQVSKVKYAEIDEKSRKNLQLTTDLENGYSKENRFRIKLYFADQIEEIMPTVQFDGLTLIKQNVALICESDIPQYLDTWSEVSDLEGFFCLAKLKSLNSNEKQSIPKTAKLTVSVSAPSFQESAQYSNTLYKEKILSFDITLVSRIKIESLYRNGVRLNKDHRSAEIKVFSNVDFQIQIDNQAKEDQGYDLIRHKLNKSESQPNEFYLKITVPREITHTFSANIILTHPLTGYRTVLPVSYESSEGETQQESYAATEDVYSDGKSRKGFFTKLWELFFGSEEDEEVQYIPKKPEGTDSGKRIDERHIQKQREKPSAFSYFIVIVILIVVVFFVMVNVFKVNPIVIINALNIQEFFSDIIDGRWPGQRRGSVERSRYDRGVPQRNVVRDPIQRDLFGVINRQPSQQRQQPQFNTPSSMQPSVRQAQPQPFSMQVPYSPGTNQSNRNSSIYDSTRHNRSLL